MDKDMVMNGLTGPQGWVRVLVVYVFGSILERTVDIFSDSSIFKVGSGINVCFWHDWWCGDGVLKDAFLDFTNSK